jgi:Transposase DDE domain
MEEPNYNRSFFGYKEHIAMTEEEIITAVEVTGGSSDDGKQFKELLNQSLDAGIEVNEVIADTTYSGKENLAEMKSKEIQPVVPLNPVVHKGGLKQEGFEYNKDADFVICPAGKHNIRKAMQGRKKSGEPIDGILLRYREVQNMSTEGRLFQSRSKEQNLFHPYRGKTLQGANRV